MKKIYLLFFALLALATQSVNAQTRYLDEVFPSVSVTSNVFYGQNATVLAYPTIIKQPLIMDVYQPTGDTETSRPVVLYLHTGNFLPFQSPIDGSLGFNGSCGGTIRDSSVVEVCTRLAKMGFVACAVDYRLGWNPIATSDVERRYGIINAAYRGVQDTRTCVRYLRKTADVGGNPWGIDTDKIVVWGQGTGGYISLASVVLDNYAKIPLASEGKFLYDHDGDPNTPPIPMVIPQVNGDIYATSAGLNPTTGDTLCYPNHVGYSSDFALALNMGGAMADSAWLDPGQTPIISFHVPYDNFAPYAEGIVNVPGTNLQVVKVQGSYVVQQLSETYGNNGAYDGQFIPELKGNQAANFANTPILNGNDWTAPTPGLYPCLQPIVQQTPVVLPATTAPWEWSGPVPVNPTCNLDRNKALATLDTILAFATPRVCFALGLQACIDQILGQNEAPLTNIDVTIAPNPSSAEMRFTTSESIRSVQVYNTVGRLIYENNNVDSNYYTLFRSEFTKGNYVVKLNFEKGFVSKVVQFL